MLFLTLKESILPLRLSYRGKVRDIYDPGDDKLIIVTTDRISAFDCILNQQVPHKGTCLNQVSVYSFYVTGGVIPNHLVRASSAPAHMPIPDPNIMIVYKTEQLPVECVVRGYLGGSALRDYKKGNRKFFTETLPDDIKPYEKLKHPIFTPTTKAETGHDANIDTMEQFIEFVGKKEDAYELVEKAITLYLMGNEMARQNDGILFDTKFEFGRRLGDKKYW